MISRSILILCASLGMPMPAMAQHIPFANNPQSCAEYGRWAVQVIQKASALGCNVQQSREVLDARFHENWCNRQSLLTMAKAHLVHRKGVAFRCANQGVDVP